MHWHEQIYIVHNYEVSLVNVNSFLTGCVLIEGHTGVFSWCVIARVYFVGNYSSWPVKNLIFKLIFVILPLHSTWFWDRKFSEWLESSTSSDLGMRFAIWILDLPKRAIFCFPQTLFLVWKYCLFSWFGETKFWYPWSGGDMLLPRSVILYFCRSWTVPETDPTPTVLPS